MFKCKECGCEFKIKPEYCDCGNNTFDEIKTSKIASTPDLQQIISVMIFILCIILSIIPWTIKSPETNTAQHIQKTETTTKEIPDIDELWQTQPINTTRSLQKNTVPKTVLPPEKVEVKPLQKPIKKTPSASTATKPQNAAPKPVKKQQQVKTVSKKPPEIVKKVSDRIFNPKQQQTVSRPKPVDMTPMINYKNELRIALLSKLNIPNIQGTGDCAVSFSIDGSGKLLNRAFVYKSSNKSVNDEVYYMLMRLPYFKKPPEIYKGEIIKLKFYFNNGYYEISFI